MAKADTFSTFSETDEMDEMEPQTVELAWCHNKQTKVIQPTGVRYPLLSSRVE